MLNMQSLNNHHQVNQRKDSIAKFSKFLVSASNFTLDRRLGVYLKVRDLKSDRIQFNCMIKAGSNH